MEDLFCSFCGRSQKEVKKLVASPIGKSFICNDCISVCADMTKEAPKTEQFEEIKLPLPEKIKEELDNYIIGQDDAKKVLSVAVYNHYKRINYNELTKKQGDEIELEKSNILMVGPTGSGKTLLAKTLAKILQVPFASCDATTLTEAGYVGEDVENVLLKLIQNANYDIKKAERGIIYIDEIDKIARKSANPSITRDVSGEGVQQALLKIIESTVASVPPQGGRKHPQQELLKIDTTNILFICGGAFVGLDKIISSRLNNSGLGFSASIKSASEVSKEELYKQLQPEDLQKFGLIPEFIGRMPITVGLHELDEKSLVDILTLPRNAITKQYQKMFFLDGINLVFTPEAVSAVAKRAIDLKTGARGLRTILEGTMVDLMYKTPSDKSIKSITIDGDVITNKAMPKIIRDKTA